MTCWSAKDGLTLLNDRPVNAETPPHLLDDPITPTARHFIRNNGVPPEEPDPETWTLTVDGLVDNPMTLSIADLKNRFDNHTMALALECGGNGRAAFDPPAKGNQWTLGAVGCSEWTGVKLKDVLSAAASSRAPSTPPMSAPICICRATRTSCRFPAACPSTRR